MGIHQEQGLTNFRKGPDTNIQTAAAVQDGTGQVLGHHVVPPPCRPKVAGELHAEN